LGYASGASEGEVALYRVVLGCRRKGYVESLRVPVIAEVVTLFCGAGTLVGAQQQHLLTLQQICAARLGGGCGVVLFRVCVVVSGHVWLMGVCTAGMK